MVEVRLMAEVRPLEDWELDIIQCFGLFGTNLTLGGASPKGEWIRARLLVRRRDYTYNMWKKWKDIRTGAPTT